jgi:threonine dehydratase
MKSINDLELIRDVNVYDVAIEIPLELAGVLSKRINNRVLMRREDLQPMFSFKLRSAYNEIAGLSQEQLTNGVN